MKTVYKFHNVTLTKYACSHFTMKRGKSKTIRIKSQRFNDLLKLYIDKKLLFDNMKLTPYVSVFHRPTRKTFYYDRGYNLMADVNMSFIFPVVSKWAGWKPTIPGQLPKNFMNLPESEFTAYWHYTSNTNLIDMFKSIESKKGQHEKK